MAVAAEQDASAAAAARAGIREGRQTGPTSGPAAGHMFIPDQPHQRYDGAAHVTCPPEGLP